MGRRRCRSPWPGGPPHCLHPGPLPGILQPASPEAGSGEWQLHNPDSLSVNRKSEAARARVRAPGPPGGPPGLSGSGCPGEAWLLPPHRGGAALCTPATTKEQWGASSMPAPGGPSRTSDKAWAPRRCQGRGGQAQAGPANWDAQERAGRGRELCRAPVSLFGKGPGHGGRPETHGSKPPLCPV